MDQSSQQCLLQIPAKRVILPKFRTRPHQNPLSDQVFDYPLSPDYVDWHTLFPNISLPFWLDLGCGYGGLLETLGPRFQNINIIGMEIRSQVVDFVENRIVKLRRGDIPYESLNINPIPRECQTIQQEVNIKEKIDDKTAENEEKDQSDNEEEDVKDVSAVFYTCSELLLTNPLQNVDLNDLSFARQPPPVIPITKDSLTGYNFTNIGILRTNSMKYTVNYFHKDQIERMFILFPDPHWKMGHIRRRVVSPSLLDEYAYCLKPGARVYTITDVPVVHHWMVWCFTRHRLFERVPEEELVNDVCYSMIFSSTADASRAEKKSIGKFPAVFTLLQIPKQ